MGLQKLILNFVLTIEAFFLQILKIKNNRITFISLESDVLTSDSKLIYDMLDKKKYDIQLCLIKYHKNLSGQFLYFLNCMKQLYYVYTSKLIIISNNNYVVSHFKRDGVKVLQLWHACGAIKKFGNSIQREYTVSGYDYVISTSDFWKDAYGEAFDVELDNVINTGMPRNDELFNKDKVLKYKENLLEKYPSLKNKKIILYAPTFRGNVYKGFRNVEFDALKVIHNLGEDYVLLYKFHPLLGNIELDKHPRIINMNHEDTHQLFCLSDYLISDYSSIVFDYMILQKPILFYIPDYEEYMEDIGVFLEIEDLKCPICKNESDVINTILNKFSDHSSLDYLKNVFFDYQDGNSTQRIVDFIYNIVE